MELTDTSKDNLIINDTNSSSIMEEIQEEDILPQDNIVIFNKEKGIIIITIISF